jgi:hypothetical protein
MSLPLRIETLSVLFIVLVLVMTRSANANNLVVTNVSLVDVGGGNADVEFDLSWDNSWYLSWTDDGGATTITNWDAAWVFIKFKTAGGQWTPAWLNASGHTATGGTVIDVASNGGVTNLGAFVHRASSGTGTLSCVNMRFRWDYSQNGLGGSRNLSQVRVDPRRQCKA